MMNMFSDEIIDTGSVLVRPLDLQKERYHQHQEQCLAHRDGYVSDAEARRSRNSFLEQSNSIPWEQESQYSFIEQRHSISWAHESPSERSVSNVVHQRLESVEQQLFLNKAEKS